VWPGNAAKSSAFVESISVHLLDDSGPGVGVTYINGPPMQELNAFWRNVDRCATPTVTING
jgi:hypothetical protein